MADHKKGLASVSEIMTRCDIGAKLGKVRVIIRKTPTPAVDREASRKMGTMMATGEDGLNGLSPNSSPLNRGFILSVDSAHVVFL